MLYISFNYTELHRLKEAVFAPHMVNAGLVVLSGLALQMLVVYPLLIRQVARRRPLQFFRLISEAILTAFGTSSSNATLPTALRVSQRNLGIDADVSRFVLTVGSTANQNGTALYEGVTVLFLAQVFGIDLTFSQQQLLLVLMSILAGIGTAGVPGGSLPLVAALLQWMGNSCRGHRHHPGRGASVGHVPNHPERNRRHRGSRLRRPVGTARPDRPRGS